MSTAENHPGIVPDNILNFFEANGNETFQALTSGTPVLEVGGLEVFRTSAQYNLYSKSDTIGLDFLLSVIEAPDSGTDRATMRFLYLPAIDEEEQRLLEEQSPDALPEKVVLDSEVAGSFFTVMQGARQLKKTLGNSPYGKEYTRKLEEDGKKLMDIASEILGRSVGLERIGTYNHNGLEADDVEYFIIPK